MGLRPRRGRDFHEFERDEFVEARNWVAPNVGYSRTHCLVEEQLGDRGEVAHLRWLCVGVALFVAHDVELLADLLRFPFAAEQFVLERDARANADRLWALGRMYHPCALSYVFVVRKPGCSQVFLPAVFPAERVPFSATSIRTGRMIGAVVARSVELSLQGGNEHRRQSFVFG